MNEEKDLMKEAKDLRSQLVNIKNVSAADYSKSDKICCVVITKAELKEYKRQAIKEFSEKLKDKVLDKTCINKDFDINISDIYKMIEETLKECEEWKTISSN